MTHCDAPSGHSPYDFDAIIDRRNTDSEKWDKYDGTDILPLWVADMDFRSPQPIIDALHNRVDHGVFGYSNPPKELTNILCRMVETTYNWAIKPEWLVYIPGLVCGLNIACRAVGEPGDAVVTATPVYPPFLSSPALSERKLSTFPLTCANNQWTFPTDVFEQAITPAAKLLLLCNPHNPVGRVFKRQELIAIGDICEKYDLVICSDEIHNGLILDESKPHIPIASLSPAVAARTITLMAPSKTFNIPGLGCSFAIISNENLRKRFKKTMAGIVPWVNVLGYAATLAAYRDCADWHSALLKYLRSNRDYVISEIATMPGLTVFPVEATYLAWIDVRSTGIDDPATFFEQAGVGLSDGKYFGTPGFVRLNFGCPRTILEEALSRMRMALEKRSS